MKCLIMKNILQIILRKDLEFKEKTERDGDRTCLALCLHAFIRVLLSQRLSLGLSYAQGGCGLLHALQILDCISGILDPYWCNLQGSCRRSTSIDALVPLFCNDREVFYILCSTRRWCIYRVCSYHVSSV